MNRREFLSRAGLGAASLLASPLPLGAAERSRRPNVLFIAVDDLNDWCGCYAGHPQAKTPNIDRLASRGVLFTNAHCQAPICNPSRVSLLTGLLPSSTGVYFLGPQLRRTELLRNAVTLPQYFGQHGYRTLGGGKIFRGRQDPASFQVQGGSFGGFGPFPKRKIAYPKGAKLWDWGAFPASDAEMPDRKLAGWAADQLKALGAVQLPEVRDDDWADLSTYAKKLTHSGAAP